MKKCPYCAEQIQDEAVVCPYCRSDLRVAPPGQPPAPAGPAPGPAPGPGTPPGPRIGEGAIHFSHSGSKYLLGYGVDFFGIWDREMPGGPVERFPRTNDGWNEAWNRYAAWEPRHVEVPLRGAPPPDLRAPQTRYASARTLARSVIVLLGLSALASLVAIAVRISVLADLSKLDPAGLLRGAAATDYDNKLAAVRTVTGLVAIPTIVLWLVWQHRAQSNLRALGAADLRFTPGWAVGWWFVPFANFVKPFQTVRELFRASDPSRGAIDWKTGPGAVVLGLWWAAWLGTIILGSVSVTVGPNVQVGGGSILIRATVRRLMAQVEFQIASDAVRIAAAALAIFIVLTIQRRQEAKRARVESMAAEGGRG